MQTMFAEHVLHVFRYTVFTLLIAWIIMRLIKLKVLTALKNSPQKKSPKAIFNRNTKKQNMTLTAKTF